MTMQWKNDLHEAWVLADGTLVVKHKVMLPTPDAQGFHYCYVINTLPKVEATAA